MSERTYSADEVQAMFKQAWQSIISHPMGQVCKHWSALEVIQAMPEELVPPREVMAALFESDDATALAY